MAERGDTLKSLLQVLTAPISGGKGIYELLPYPNPAAGSGLSRTIPGDYWERMIAVSFNFVASATSARRSLAFQFQNGDGVPFLSVPIIAEVNTSQSISVFGYRGALPYATWDASQSYYGTATSPGAATTIVSAGTYPPGLYQIEWTVELQGTTTAGTDNDNFKLVAGGTTVEQSVNGFAVGAYPQQNTFVDLSVAGTITVANINAGTSGAVYSSNITVIPQTTQNTNFVIPDITIQSGWIAAVVGNQLQAGDQISTVNFLLERYASDYANGGYQDELDSHIRTLLGQAVMGELIPEGELASDRRFKGYPVATGGPGRQW